MQLGAGCLVDQLVGQYMAHVCGLGYLLNREHVATTLASIMRYNFRDNFYNHFNHMRSFVLNDDAGLLMCSYPRGRRPPRPFPYYTEVMTGFEYTAAVGMLYEGQTDDALRCIAAIRARYDGKTRSPFDEAECGHHYARAMASWGALLALTGFHYSGVTQTMTFDAPFQHGQAFWSNGYAWGICTRAPTEQGVVVELRVLHGTLPLQRLMISGVGSVALDRAQPLAADEQVVLVVQEEIEN